jgi:hypothetical protein
MKAELLFECNTCCKLAGRAGLIETLITNCRSRGDVRDEQPYPRPFRCNMCFKPGVSSIRTTYYNILQTARDS